jgi:glycosyltransferase involved in cell wall biosynthesis
MLKSIYPLVSVTITSKNEANNIKNCLESIIYQTWKNIEIIVVDNNSNDDTKKIALEYTSQVYNRGPERSAQRNYGIIQKSKGKYAIYVDADMILSPLLIEAAVEYMEKSDAVGLYVSEVIIGNSYLCKVRNFERGFYNCTPIDGVRFFLRDKFIESGGFDEKVFSIGSGEDWDLDKSLKKIGKILELQPSCRHKMIGDWPIAELILNNGININNKFCGIYHNESNFSLKYYIFKKMYYARGFEGYILKWGGNDEDIKKQFGFIYRYWTVFTENGKWKVLVSRLDLTLGLYFLKILVGFSYIFSKIVKNIEIPSR